MESETTTTECCGVESVDGTIHEADCLAVIDGATPLAEGIRMGRAVRVARRVYVRCGYRSQLNDQMRALGAKWDRGHRALWTGTGKADQVAALVTAADERKAQAADAIASGIPVKIPFARTDVRVRAKEAGARWDRDRKVWVLPTADAAAEIESLLTPATKPEAERRQTGGRLASPKQVAYAARLIASGAWHDSDAGQGFHPPTAAELEAMTAGEISDLISDLKGTW